MKLRNGKILPGRAGYGNLFWSCDHFPGYHFPFFVRADLLCVPRYPHYDCYTKFVRTFLPRKRRNGKVYFYYKNQDVTIFLNPFYGAGPQDLFIQNSYKVDDLQNVKRFLEIGQSRPLCCSIHI